LLEGLGLEAALGKLIDRGLRELLLRLEEAREELVARGRVDEFDFRHLTDQLHQALGQGDGARVDSDLIQRVLGPAGANSLERIRGVVQALEAIGLVRSRGERLELTFEGVQRIGRKALRDVFSQLRPGKLGSHQAPRAGPAGDGADETRRYDFGGAFRLDLGRTLMNAVTRSGPGTPMRLIGADFEVRRAEQRVRCATVLLLDTSRSMLLRGCVGAAKRVAIALDTLIRAGYPGDVLRVVGFADRARPLTRDELVGYDFNQYAYGTNLQDGLRVARRLLEGERGATRQVVLITDGEPTAHFEQGQVHFAYPPTFQTFRETLREAGRCTRDGITINTFMLERSPQLTEFVDQLTRVNKGRSFFADAARLGEYVLVDYVVSQRKWIA